MSKRPHTAIQRYELAQNDIVKSWEAIKRLSFGRKRPKRNKQNKKPDLLRSFKMWNLLERIINALKPSEQPQQPYDQSQQPSDQSQSWNEESSEQQESPREPASVSQQNEWQNS